MARNESPQMLLSALKHGVQLSWYQNEFKLDAAEEGCVYTQKNRAPTRRHRRLRLGCDQSRTHPLHVRAASPARCSRVRGLVRQLFPHDWCWRQLGGLLVSGSWNHAFRAIRARDRGQGCGARFDSPACLGLDPDGNVMVAEEDNHSGCDE